MVLQHAICRLNPHPSPKMDTPHRTLYKRHIRRTDPLGSGSRLKESRGTDTKVKGSGDGSGRGSKTAPGSKCGSGSIGVTTAGS